MAERASAAPWRQRIVQHKQALTQLQGTLAALPDIAAELEESSADKTVRRGLTQRVDALDDMARRLIDLARETEYRIEALDRFQHTSLPMVRGCLTQDAWPAEYDTYVRDRVEAYTARTTRQKYAKHPAYIEFRSRVWRQVRAVPDAESGDEQDDDDDDIVVGGTVQQYRCPLTALPLQDPVVNTLCQHAYSREAVLTYIAEQRAEHRAAKCPAAGCTQRLAPSSLRDAPELKRRVERFERQLARREEQRREQAGAAPVLH